MINNDNKNNHVQGVAGAEFATELDRGRDLAGNSGESGT
jgi:hypothetical protein